MNSRIIYFLVLPILIGLLSCDKFGATMDIIKADTAYNQANFKKAIELYEKVLENEPHKADLQWKLGIAYYSNNEKLKVAKQASKLRKLNRNDLADDLEQLTEK